MRCATYLCLILCLILCLSVTVSVSVSVSSCGEHDDTKKERQWDETQSGEVKRNRMETLIVEVLSKIKHTDPLRLG